MDLPKVEELKKIIKFCRENGINSLKHGEFEVTLSASAHFPEKPKKDDGSPSSPVDQKLQNDAILFWSADPFAMSAAQEEPN